MKRFLLPSLPPLELPCGKSPGTSGHPHLAKASCEHHPTQTPLCGQRRIEKEAETWPRNNVYASPTHRRWGRVREVWSSAFSRSCGFIIFVRTLAVLTTWRTYLEIHLVLCRDNHAVALVTAHLFRSGLELWSEGRCYALLFVLSSSLSNSTGTQ